jgi:hypothetical protein
MGSHCATARFCSLAVALFLFINPFSLAEAKGGTHCLVGVDGNAHAAEGAFSGDLCREKEAPRGSFILLILDKITLSDLLSYSGPLLTSLLQKSSLGLMNVNTAGSLGTESGYLTIGAGNRLQGNWAVRKAYNRGEEKGQSVEVLYRRHSGKGVVPPGAVLHPYTGALESLNSNRSCPASLGALGEMLTRNGFPAAVIGNADTDQEGRQAVTITMNRDGVVAYGDVSTRLLKEDRFFPFGYRCSAQVYLDVYRACSEKASLIAVEWGDTERIDAYLGHLSAERRGEFLQSSFEELDLFLGGLLADRGFEGRLVILVPSPPQAPVAGGYRLTPIVYHNPGNPRGGLLVSRTTRVPGIVANIDIAPSVAEHLGLPSPVCFAGAPLQAEPFDGHLQKISALAERTARTYQQRPSIIKGYLLVLIIFTVTGLAGIVTRFYPVRLLRPAFYGLLYFPLSFLLAPAFAFFPAGSYLLNFCFLVVLTAVFVVLSELLWRSPMAFFSGAGFMVFGLLTVDLLSGSILQSRSFLGYDPIGGARFYGIGNEYMGVMIGSFILGFGSFISLRIKGQKEAEKGGHLANFSEIRVPIWLFATLSVIILFLMASPSFGANFGGAVTAALSLSLTLGGFIALFYGGDPLLWFRSLLKRRKRALSLITFVSIPLLFILLTGLLLYYLNLPRPGADISHLGRTLELVQKNGFGELLNIASRKLEMNYKLVRYSLWTRALLVMIALIAILYYYPTGLIKNIYAGEPGFRVAMGGIIAASVTALLVNDSGVVAAATIMLYGGLPLLILALEKNLNKINDTAGNLPDKMEI